MRRLLPLVGCTLALVACEVVESERPLFAGGGPAPKGGLWALLADNCSTPETTAVQRWPSCATPFWVEGDQLTALSPSPQRSTFVVAAGSPAILQLRAAEEAGDPEDAPYSYAAFRPHGASPFAAADVWLAACMKSDTPVPGFLPDTCTATSSEAVRSVAGAAAAHEPQAKAVWIAP